MLSDPLLGHLQVSAGQLSVCIHDHRDGFLEIRARLFKPSISLAPYAEMIPTHAPSLYHKRGTEEFRIEGIQFSAISGTLQ
jgi:hypothetical protein